MPNFNDRKAHHKLVTECKEKYCAYSGDDDFLIPKSIDKCTNFLEENNDYRTAQGKSMIFYFKKDGVYGNKIYSGAYLKNTSIEFEKSSDRAIHFGKNYFTPVFSVRRTKEYLQDLKNFDIIPDKNFGELIQCFSTICNGKSKELDCLYLVRQVHNKRYTMKSGLDWIKKKKLVYKL